MFEIWLWNGRYIQGRLAGAAKTEKGAVKKAKELLTEEFHGQGPFKTEKSGKETWLDANDGTPLGIIVPVERQDQD